MNTFDKKKKKKDTSKFEMSSEILSIVILLLIHFKDLSKEEL